MVQMTNTPAPDERFVTVEVISGVEGPCLAIDDTRVAGPKPWGGGRVVYTFKVKLRDLKDAAGVPKT